MPLEGNHANDAGPEVFEGTGMLTSAGEEILRLAGRTCKFDSENGKVKSGEKIFEGGVAFFAEAVTSGNRELAERLTRKNMKSLPYWQAHPFAKLTGPEATDDEFNAALAKL